MPTTKDIVKFCEKEFGKEEKELSFFKLNAFDDPIKRINIKNFSVKNLEIEGSVRVMVKDTPNRLDFELMALQIFTTTDYAVNEEKQFTIKVPMDGKISMMKQMIIDEMIVQGLLEKNSKPADYLFQNLNIYNVPSKYFINENSLVKKHIFRSNKVLVRKNDKEKPIDKNKICLFLRKRDSESRTYGKRIEFLHNGNKRNINTKTYNAFKKTIYDAIDDEEKKGLDCFELAIVDYKHFQWKPFKNNFICLKDGDEIGYILDINENKSDDLQTTYLSNLSKSHDVSGETVYTRMIEEKGFLIKPNDSK